MKEAVILGAVRTPIGTYGGSLAGFSASDLGGMVIAEAIKRAGISPDIVEEVIMGNVIQTLQGQNTARQMTLKGGLPLGVTAWTLNKVCGSGLKTVALAAQAIIAGDAQCLVAGGAESMSQAPYAVQKARFGVRMGDVPFVDTMIKDGLWCAFNDYHMGITAENVAEKYGITREMQDEFALASQKNATEAIKNGLFIKEILPVTIKSKKGETVFDTDEYPRAQTTMESLAKLKPAFKKDGGTVTAGNSSGLNDGGCAMVVMDAELASKLNLKPMARIVASATAGVDPAIMGIAPVPATQKVLKKAGWTVDDLDLIEANEAFAAQCVASAKELKLDPAKINVHGGSIALGHPIGCSGARILTTLIYALEARGKKRGLATLCIGGGQSVALLVELL